MTNTTVANTPEKLPEVSLVFLRDVDFLFLAIKKRGFGKGRWNGYGGKTKEGETVLESAIRETEEESTATPKQLGKVAILNFYFPENKEAFNQRVHVYFCDEWDGEPQETEEMCPYKFEEASIPYADMWPGDKYWLPRVLNLEIIEADFYFNDDDQVVKHAIRPLVNW